MNFPELNPAEFMAFSLILIRVSIILAITPIFGSPMVPSQIKIALILVLTLALANNVKIDVSAYPTETLSFAILMLGELMIGLAIALLVRLILESVQVAGQYIGYQMGFAIVSVFDPQTGGQTSVISEFAYILSLLIFLAFNGHYIIIKALSESFTLILPGRFDFSSRVMDIISIQGVGQMFILAVKIAAPTLAVLFFAMISMGIVAKTVPQMNILFVGLPLYIIVGLFILGLSLSFLIPMIGQALVALDKAVIAMLRIM